MQRPGDAPLALLSQLMQQARLRIVVLPLGLPKSLPLYLKHQLRYSYRPHSDNAISPIEKQIRVKILREVNKELDPNG